MEGLPTKAIAKFDVNVAQLEAFAAKYNGLVGHSIKNNRDRALFMAAQEETQTDLNEPKK